MIARPDAVSYTLPLQKFLDFLFHTGADLEQLWSGVEGRPVVKREWRNVIEKGADCVWRNSAELVETHAHYFEGGWQAALVWAVEAYFHEHLRLPCEVEQTLGRGRNNFNYSVNFKGGFVAFGGNNKTLQSDGSWIIRPERMQIYLSGDYCQTLTSEQWWRLFEWSKTVDDIKITRCDLCVDDLEGKYSVAYALEQFEAGAFATGRGRPPKGKHMRCLGDCKDGETLYVGSRQSGKLARIYEKGRQLGDESSPWVRWEGELLAKDREIPLDAVVNCDAYFKGMYPAFAVVLEGLDSKAGVVGLRTGRTKAKTILGHLRNHCRRSYGPLITYMVDKLEMSSDAVIAALRADSGSRPARLSMTALDALCIGLFDRETGELSIPV